MILNPSHKLTSSGLPPDVLEVYVRYKRNTRGLLTWFQQQDPKPGAPFENLTIKCLETLVQKVAKSLISLPDIVHFYFQGAISDRKRLSKYYRTQVDGTIDDAGTLGHEHFTAFLEKIYTDLCARLGHLKPQGHPKQSPPTSQVFPEVNQSERLAVEEAKDAEEQDNGDLEIPKHFSATIPAPQTSSRKGTDIHLADDELGIALEVMAAAQRIQNISASIDGYWGAAGKGTISFVVASFLTNAAFASLRQVVSDLLQHDESLSTSKFFEICSSFRGSFETELRNQKIVGTNNSLTSRLQHIARTLADCQDDEDLFMHDPSCARCGHNFAAQVHSIVAKKAGGSRFISSAMTENIVHWVSSEIIPLNSIMRSTPVYSDVAEDLITDVKDSKTSWDAVLGLNLLTQSYRVYLHYLKQPHLVPKSRIIALKLAQQCMALDLQCYASHNCWDLVFQSPWVAGNHVLEVLDLCNYYGYYLLKYRNYMGAVLHAYNALTQLGGLDKIPALEKIGTQFCGILFPGGNLPKSNFHACWARYVGARLKFKKNHKGKNTHDNWCLAIPARAAKVAAGIDIPNQRQNDKLGCLLFNIKQQDYHISDVQCTELNDAYAKAQEMRKKNGTKEMPDINSQSSGAVLEKQKLLPLAVTTQTMFASSAKTLPLARINVFAAFERCVRVVSAVSDKMHHEEHLGKGDYCICFANELLEASDRLVKGRRFGKLEAWKEHERKLVEDMKEALLEAFGNVKDEELLWDV
ncbi:hypothetical protein H2200_006698 [Cladophialophora chaetospira]|uniref:DUF6604 domain-containing protein n=1 Tax=Cladophialophora chaetospira TaxID=386627 RepID=A0AA38X9A2_9EURO|nr:hypothetical protein H2200_006698 [Cladophialophora chaetospira]